MSNIPLTQICTYEIEYLRVSNGYLGFGETMCFPIFPVSRHTWMRTHTHFDIAVCTVRVAYFSLIPGFLWAHVVALNFSKANDLMLCNYQI